MPGICTSASTQPGASAVALREKVARRRKCLDREAARPQQPRDRGQKRRIVIDDMNGGFELVLIPRPPSATGSVKRNAAPPPLCVLCPEPAAVRLDDRAGDRQAHAHAVRLGGEERVEDLREHVPRNAGSGVAPRRSRRSAAPSRRAVTRTRRSSRLAPLSASMPLRMRLSSTCCRCTRSPRTRGRSPGTSTSSFTCRARRIDAHQRRDVAHERAHVEPPASRASAA